MKDLAPPKTMCCVWASRLRHCAPPQTELGRLTDDGFLLLMRNEDEIHLLTRWLEKYESG